MTEIRDANGKLLARRWYIVNSKFFGIFLNKLLASDKPPAHDHSWDGLIVALNRSYWDYRVEAGRFVRAFWRWPFLPLFRRAEEFHYIEVNGPTWILVIRFRDRREWGFQTAEGWIEHRTWKAAGWR